MANLKLISNHNIALPVAIRDHKLKEVWSGILQDEQELDLPDGHYLVDINGLKGREQFSFQSEGTQQSVVIGENQPNNNSLDVSFETGAFADASDEIEYPNATNSRDAGAGVRLESISTRKVQSTLRLTAASRAFKSNPRLSPLLESSRDVSNHSQSIAMWTKTPHSDWQLNSSPTLEDILGEGPTQRFLRVSGPGRLPMLVAMPNFIKSVSIPMNPRLAADVLIAESDANVMALRAMMERHDSQEAALMAANLAKCGGEKLPGAAQVALALVSLFAELREDERPSLEWFKELAFTSPQLADPLVAYAWYGLYLDLLDEQEIAHALTSSVEYGVPRLTKGLQLLHRGLELLAYDGAKAGVNEAREAVSRWVNHMQPDTFFTTFTGDGHHILMNTRTTSEMASKGVLPGTPIKQLNVRQVDGYLIIER